MFCVIPQLLRPCISEVLKNRPPVKTWCPFLVSPDEIHQDLALFGHRHTSFNTVDPSFKDFSLIHSVLPRSFNIAGTKILCGH